LLTVYNTISKLEKTESPRKLKDIFSKNARLRITPTDKCSANCYHCVADSSSRGKPMDYFDFARIPARFFRIFKAVDFGRRGNPLLYQSEGRDLADIISFLKAKGIKKFTLALALQEEELPVMRRLEELASKGISLETMVTYHHYNAKSQDQIAESFNESLKNFMAFSNTIIISLIGHKFIEKEKGSAKEVNYAFERNKDKIFSGIGMKKVHEEEYEATYNQNTARIIIPPIDNRIYPLGRFRDYLRKKGCLEYYEKKFNQSLTDYVCPDLITWPGIIIEPNGDLNLCASFEAITCDKAVVSNIFFEDYEQVEQELIEFNYKEREWFINNLEAIVQGKVSSCKLKNNCYEK
jgi:hypothetical protein